MGLASAAEVTATGGPAVAWRLRSHREQPEATISGATAVMPGRGRDRAVDREDQSPDKDSNKARNKTSKKLIPDHISAVLEIEPLDAILPSPDPPAPIPPRLLTDLRADPLLGLADIRLVQHIQPTGHSQPTGAALAEHALALSHAQARAHALAAQAAHAAQAHAHAQAEASASYQTLNHDLARRLGTEPIPAARLTWLALRLELPGSRRQALAARAGGPILARGGGMTGAQRTLDKAARAASAKLSPAGYHTLTLADSDYRPGYRSEMAETHDFLDAEGVSAAPGGVLIGVDPAHRPVTLGLFRRMTLNAAVVGGRYLAETLVLRCAAIGARVIVETARKDEWDPVLLHSGLGREHLTVQPVGRPVGNPGWPAPSMVAPLLVVRDCGARPPFATVPRGPWTTIVTLLPYFDPRTAGYLRDADLVGMQRMPREEAAMARHLLGLSDKDTAALPDLPDSMVLWRSRKRSMRYCELAQTRWEQAFLGEPLR